VHVEQDDVWAVLEDRHDRLADASRLTDDIDALAQLCSHAGAKQIVIVDDNDAHARAAALAHDAPIGLIDA
jgi:hypothetical protein